MSGITDFCKHLQTAVPPLDTLLPMSLFPESGNLLTQLSRLSRFLSRSQYVRIVDKGAGEMWGFCSAWLWDQVEEFMRKEKFTHADCTMDQWNNRIAKVVRDMSLQRNPKGRLCILYVLAKAKSLRTGKWVFRGISASPAPVLNNQQLRLAARSLPVCCACCSGKSHTTSSVPTSNRCQGGSSSFLRKVHSPLLKWTARNSLIT